MERSRDTETVQMSINGNWGVSACHASLHNLDTQIKRKANIVSGQNLYVEKPLKCAVDTAKNRCLHSGHHCEILQRWFVSICWQNAATLPGICRWKGKWKLRGKLHVEVGRTTRRKVRLAVDRWCKETNGNEFVTTYVIFQKQNQVEANNQQCHKQPTLAEWLTMMTN